MSSEKKDILAENHISPKELLEMNIASKEELPSIKKLIDLLKKEGKKNKDAHKNLLELGKHISKWNINGKEVDTFLKERKSRT